jgi:hypothetical protein
MKTNEGTRAPGLRTRPGYAGSPQATLTFTFVAGIALTLMASWPSGRLLTGGAAEGFAVAIFIFWGAWILLVSLTVVLRVIRRRAAGLAGHPEFLAESHHGKDWRQPRPRFIADAPRPAVAAMGGRRDRLRHDVVLAVLAAALVVLALEGGSLLAVSIGANTDHSPKPTPSSPVPTASCSVPGTTAVPRPDSTLCSPGESPSSFVPGS